MSRFVPALLFLAITAYVWPRDPVLGFLFGVFALVGAMLPLTGRASEPRLPISFE